MNFVVRRSDFFKQTLQANLTFIHDNHLTAFYSYVCYYLYTLIHN